MSLALVILPLAVACGNQNGEELGALRSAVASLEEELDALRKDLAEMAANSGDNGVAPVDGVDRAEALARGVDALEQTTGQLAWRMEALEGRMGALEESAKSRHSAVMDRLHRAAEETPIPEGDGFTLQLLHASDMDGSTGALDNVENFSALLDGFREQFPDNTLVVSSGDNYIPGPRYYAAGDDTNDPVLGVSGNGRGDIALLNAMGFQASALGNHELDRGTGAYRDTIRFESDDGGFYPGAAFPYLSSNLVFATDQHLAGLVTHDGQDAMVARTRLAKSVVVTIEGESVGIVGATTPSLRSITAAGGITVLPPAGSGLDALAGVIQQEVDALVGQGTDKVVLLAHMQLLEIEKALATRLSDVDIIVAGGSNTLLADDTDRLRPGDEAEGDYPLLFESSKGDPVLVVNTDADYRYLGRLVVEFDGRGTVLPESIDPHVSGAYSTHWKEGQGFAGEPIAAVSRIVESLRSVLRDRDGKILGKTEVYLSGERRDVRTQETNLGNLTADANLWVARQIDPEVAVSFKNAGGIRSSIGMVVQPPGTIDPLDVMYLPPQANRDTGKEAGDISQFDIEGTARFNNGLAIVTLTARELFRIVEHSISFDGPGETAAGRFPQVGGMRLSFEPAARAGERVRSLAIVDMDGRVTDRVVEDGTLAGDPGRMIKVVTLDFLANGGDDFPFPAPSVGRVDLRGEAGQFNAPDPDFPDTNGNGVVDGPVAMDSGLADFSVPGAEQDALAEYLAHFHAEVPFARAETPPLEDRRIQNLGITGKLDTVFETASGSGR